MARKAAPKKQRVFNTGNGVTKPVWNNADRINHANHFLPRSVILNPGRPNVNSVRPRVNTVNSNINTVRSRQLVPTRTSNSFSPKRPQGNWGSAVKTSAGYNWRNSKLNSNCDCGPTFIRTVNAKDHPLKNMVDRGIFDSGCSEHMTGASEVTNSACTSQTLYSNASEERDEDVELIVVPSTVRNTKEKAESRKSSTNSKKEEILTEPQQEKKGSSTDTSKDNPKILAFRTELKEISP
ncbi:hypothetical protein Tco_1223640 [Tanacetum coccineum]